MIKVNFWAIPALSENPTFKESTGGLAVGDSAQPNSVMPLVSLATAGLHVQ